ncbi:MAG: riboflavin synthase [Micromonosporaceae bacterium]|nr:riboflavin synthase [Micromonosporaceae bacterium]
MFTGIVEELGEVTGLGWVPGGRSALLRVRGPLVVTDTKDGDSIAVNGVCLTVVEVDGDEMSFDVMRETLDRSALGSLRPGDPVNLERAVTVASRLGGHIVQGHVDGVGTVASVEPGDAWTDVRISLPAELARYIVPKGSVCVDGVSLTVVSVADAGSPGQPAGDSSVRPQPASFTVSLIPTTLARTTLGIKRPGALVNLEVDVIAKYVERLLRPGGAETDHTGGSI